MRMAETADTETLVGDCLPLVRRVAASMASRLPSQVELSDLIQAGFVGLLDAARKFDRDKGVRFWTYAELRIRGAILDSLRELDRVPRSVRRRRREIDGAVNRLQARLGRQPKESELAGELGLAKEELRKNLERLRLAESTTETTEGIDAVLALIPDPDALDPQQLMERRQMKLLLARSIESLSERERLVITLYYHEELTMREIGEILGVNESRISQIHQKAIRRLRLRLKPQLRPQPLSVLARTA